MARYYVACLAAYNNGKMHGEWFELTDDESEIQENIDKVIESSPEEDAEEWAIHDYDGAIFNGLGENPSLCQLTSIATLIDACEDEDEAEAILSLFDNDVDRALQNKDEVSCCASFSEFAQQMADEMLECSENSDFAKRYFDYESWERDLRYDYYVEETPSRAYIVHAGV